MKNNTENSVLTVSELADYLKVPKSTIYKLAQEERLPGQKVGRHWRFRREAIDKWLEETGPRFAPETHSAKGKGR